MRAAVAICLLVLGCAGAKTSPATDGERPPRRFLEPPAEFPAVFTIIRAVMALPDGRIVVSDPAENRVSLIDFPKGTARLLGRVGEGPLEFKRAAGLYRAPGGGVWVFDHELRRLLPILPSGELGEVVQVGYGGLAGSKTGRGPDDLTFDSLGQTYSFQHGGWRLTDSSGFVLRRHPGAHTDTMSRLARAQMKALDVKRNGTGNYQTRLFSSQDAWVAAPDGWIAVVRADPYRVEWVSPAGQTVIGPAIKHKAIRVSEAEKKFVASGADGWRGRTSVSLVMVAPGGLAPGRAAAPEPIPVRELWFAKVKMPLNLRNDGWPLLDERGRLWVSRSLPFGAKVSVFDIFDRRGNLVDRVELPAGSRLVGFDRQWLYAARLDADDFEHLQRFPLPR